MNLLEEKVQYQLSKLDENYQSKKYLVAASGGSDSTCLIYIFKNLKLNFELAHCNFKLRGEESNEDEEFVKTLADKTAVKFNVIQFNTSEIVEKNKTSIQEEARFLRYNWFKSLAKENHLDYIVTAHHQDDLIETFFINAIRGSGLLGLKSIPIKNKGIIRPLLYITKEEINDYLEDFDLSYRKDSSNESLKYSRNYLRHKIIPILDNVHPNAKKGVLKTIQNTIETEDYLRQKIEEDKEKIVKKEEGFIKINLDDCPSNFILYTIIKEYGFNKTQLVDLMKAKHKGSLFYSDSFTMLKDNSVIIISPIKLKESKSYEFSKIGNYNIPFNITFSEVDTKEIIYKRNVAYFDAEKVNFPFLIRKWKEGDRFTPFGMKGNKKLSDFFIDLKLNRIEKEQVWILESDNKICWVVGKRIEDQFKITKTTTKVIKIVTK